LSVVIVIVVIVVVVVVPGHLIQGIRGDGLRKSIERMGSIRKLLGS